MYQTMPENGKLSALYKSDCKWKTFVITGELYGWIVINEVK